MSSLWFLILLLRKFILMSKKFNLIMPVNFYFMFHLFLFALMLI